MRQKERRRNDENDVASYISKQAGERTRNIENNTTKTKQRVELWENNMRHSALIFSSIIFDYKCNFTKPL